MFKRLISVFIIVAMILSFAVGCNNNAPDDQPDIGDTAETNIEIQDMAGRTIILPEAANKAFATFPTGTIMLYSLNPEKMIGWNYNLSEGEKKFIAEECHDLPNLGGAGKESINVEEILKIDPDVLIMMEELEESSISRAEELEQQIKKPVIILDTALDKLDEAYTILGKALGEETKAKELAMYCKETMDSIEENISEITEEKGVYYAQGPDGLLTEPSGSWHAEIIDMVGGRNVAEVDVKVNQGKSEVSMEQLLIWDPDIIIFRGDGKGSFYSLISEDPAWQNIKAVKDEEVYEIPEEPFNWFDRPPSSNRVLGAKWTANLLYPEIFDYDINDEIKEFYEKFYHYELSEEKIEELTENSVRH